MSNLAIRALDVVESTLIPKIFNFSTMEGPKGKELVKRLSWLIRQDEEHFKVQLEQAVSFYTLSFGNGLGNGFYSMKQTRSRVRSRISILTFVYLFRVLVVRILHVLKQLMLFWPVSLGRATILLWMIFKLVN